jgi:hypothetical protein
MFDATRLEIELRRAYALAYPWLHKVRPLPGSGLHDVCGLRYGSASANESTFIAQPGR